MLDSLRILLQFNKLLKALKETDMLGLLKSRTVWTFIGMALFNGVEGLKDQLPAAVAHIVNPLLALAGIYFRANAKPK